MAWCSVKKALFEKRICDSNIVIGRFKCLLSSSSECYILQIKVVRQGECLPMMKYIPSVGVSGGWEKGLQIVDRVYHEQGVRVEVTEQDVCLLAGTVHEG